MAATSLNNQTKPIATNAFAATFMGHADDAKIADAFGKKFAQMLANAIHDYVAQCIVLPVGGPVQAASPATLKQAMIDAAHDAYVETFQKQDDENDIASKFAKPFGNFANAMQTYMTTCVVVPATPPVKPITTGPWQTVPPSTSLVPVMFKCAFDGMEATFQNEADPSNIKTLFASIMQNIGNLIAPYVMTCIPTGPGPLPAK